MTRVPPTQGCLAALLPQPAALALKHAYLVAVAQASVTLRELPRRPPRPLSLSSQLQTERSHRRSCPLSHGWKCRHVTPVPDMSARLPSPSTHYMAARWTARPLARLPLFIRLPRSHSRGMHCPEALKLVVSISTAHDRALTRDPSAPAKQHSLVVQLLSPATPTGILGGLYLFTQTSGSAIPPDLRTLPRRQTPTLRLPYGWLPALGAQLHSPKVQPSRVG
jgi:hypothetical protein